MTSVSDMTVRELHEAGYVCVVFTPADAQSLRETWDLDKCAEQLADNAKYIDDRLIELGWDVLDTLLDRETEESIPADRRDTPHFDMGTHHDDRED